MYPVWTNVKSMTKMKILINSKIFITFWLSVLLSRQYKGQSVHLIVLHALCYHFTISTATTLIKTTEIFKKNWLCHLGVTKAYQIICIIYQCLLTAGPRPTGIVPQLIIPPSDKWWKKVLLRNKMECIPNHVIKWALRCLKALMDVHHIKTEVTFRMKQKLVKMTCHN